MKLWQLIIMNLYIPITTKIIKSVLSSLLIFSTSAVVNAETTVEWVDRALDLQERIDLEAPLAHTTFIGTHNSYNSAGNGYPFPNQTWGLTHQLNKNVREIVFDVYYDGTGQNLYLCHKTCDIVHDKTLGWGLRAIKSFLNDNPNAVIILKMEIGFADRDTKFINKITDILGEQYIFAWQDHKDTVGPSGQKVEGACHVFDASTLTKQHILNQGKNVIILTDKCYSNNPEWIELIYTGVKKFDDHNHSNNEAGGIDKHKLEKTNSVSDICGLSDDIREQEMTRAFDDRVEAGNATSFTGSVNLKHDRLKDFLSCGLNIFEMYDISEAKREKLVWSWDEGYPRAVQAISEYDLEVSTLEELTELLANGEISMEEFQVYFAFLNANPFDDKITIPPYAVMHRSSKRFRNKFDNETYRFACRKDISPARWRISDVDGSFSDGDDACAQLGDGTFRFAVPRNAKEMGDLIEAYENKEQNTGSSFPAVWVNYAKRRNDGTLGRGKWTAEIGLDTEF